MKKKIVLLILQFPIVILTTFAQDVIYKKDSTRIQAKVSEVTETVIKYKKFSNPTGPSYELSKSEIVKIVYPDGSVDDFSKQDSTTAKSSVDKMKQTVQAYVNAGLISNGKTTIKLNGKDYVTEFNQLTVDEESRQESLFSKNRSSVFITLTTTIVTKDKKIAITLIMTENDMKPATFKANKSNTLERVDRQFSITINNINPNMYNGFGGSNIIPINNIKMGKLIIDSIDKDNKKLSGTIQVLGSSVDGGKVELEGSFVNISY